MDEWINGALGIGEAVGCFDWIATFNVSTRDYAHALLF
jgi:hypothetical protein